MNKKRMQIIDRRVNEILLIVKIMNDNPKDFKKEDFDRFGNILEVMEALEIIEMEKISDTQFTITKL